MVHPQQSGQGEGSEEPEIGKQRWKERREMERREERESSEMETDEGQRKRKK